MNQKGFVKITLVLIVIIFAGAAYWYWGNEIKLTFQTWNWKTYRNNEFGFEFKYPPQYSLKAGEEDFCEPTPNFPLCSSKVFRVRLIDDGISVVILVIDNIGSALVGPDCAPDCTDAESVASIINNPNEIKIYKHYYDDPVREEFRFRYAFNKSGVDYWAEIDSKFDHQYDLSTYDGSYEKLADQIIHTFKFTKD